ncbi:MAG: hypothetical protein R2809_11935 [Flavobacteriales bacterium]
MLSALFAAVAYFFATKNTQDSSWIKSARISFYVHTVAVIGVVGTLLYMLVNHLYEYKYVGALEQ